MPFTSNSLEIGDIIRSMIQSVGKIQGEEVLEVAESHVIEETEAKDYLQKHPEEK